MLLTPQLLSIQDAYNKLRALTEAFDQYHKEAEQDAKSLEEITAKLADARAKLAAVQAEHAKVAAEKQAAETALEEARKKFSVFFK